MTSEEFLLAYKEGKRNFHGVDMRGVDMRGADMKGGRKCQLTKIAMPLVPLFISC